MRILFVVVALCGVLVACTDEIDPEEYNEPSLCLEERNPFAYSHCIKKRDTGCQSGGFCGTCNSNSCQACNSHSCRTTCNGSSCNQCPTGDCCNGQNCNVCSGMNCCNTISCNTCTNNCNHGCSTFACRSACLQKCQTITTTCSCNWETNNCFNMCRNDCMGDHCYEQCFKKCKCDEGCTTTISPIVDRSRPPIVATPNITIENKPVNSNPVNISTVINLKTFVNNINTIHNPINITISQKTSETVSTTTTKAEPPKQCCYVIHPVHCFNINQPPYKRCIQHRHWECSDICISVVVHLVHLQTEKVIEKQIPVYISQPTRPPTNTAGGIMIVPPPLPPTNTGGGVIIVPPQPPQQIQRCYYTNQYPWVHCNHLNVQGCGSCYVCGNQQYNPTVCSTQATCSGLCRGGIVYDTSIGAQILRYAPMYGPYVGLPPALVRRQG